MAPINCSVTVFLVGARTRWVDAGSRVGGADRTRRPAVPPWTRWPRSGQSKPRKTAYPLPAGAGLLVSAAIGPGRRGRAGRPSQGRARRGERRTRRRRRRLDKSL